MRAVTPLLSVGPEDQAQSPLNAYIDILFSQPTVVKDDTDARDVMQMLELDEELIEDRIRFSHTGEVTVER